MAIITVIIFILILSVLVIIHELGHFLAAKYFGMGVSEFGIGMPPKLCQLGRRRALRKSKDVRNVFPWTKAI